MVTLVSFCILVRYGTLSYRAKKLDLIFQKNPVLGIRIRMFLGLPDPDLFDRGADPDPAHPFFFLINVLSGLK